MRVVGYVRVSTEEQLVHGASIDAQRSAIERHCASREGWEVADVVEERASAKSIDGRPILAELLGSLDEGAYDGLVIARLDRLSRSSLDFWSIMARADRNGWSLVCLHPMVDMTDAYGRMLAGIGAVVAQFERELIGQRTSEGIAAKKAAGTYSGGRPRLVDRDVEKRIQRMSGSHRAVAAELNALGVPSPTGGEWGHSTVGAIRRRA